MNLILEKASLDLFKHKDRINGKSCLDEIHNVPNVLKKKIQLDKTNSEKERAKNWRTSPAHYAAINKDYVPYCFLSFLGANFKAKSKEGNSVYKEFLKSFDNDSQYFNEVNAFVKWWILRVTDQHWLRLFRIAAKEEYKNCLNILIENKTNVNVWSNKDGNTALIFALEKNLVQAMQKLIDKKADVNASNFKGNTPLHFAAENGNIESMTYLIENGAKVNEKNVRKETALHLVFGSPKEFSEKVVVCTKALIAAGAEVNAKDKYNRSPLLWAVKSDLPEEEKEKCLKVIAQAGSDLSTKNFVGETPLHYAAKEGKIAILKWLLEEGASVNEENRRNQTPLHYLFLHSKKFSKEIGDCTSSLVAAGADVNAKDEWNYTPLHRAVKSRMSDEEKEKCCEILIKAGSDLSTRNDKGETPMDNCFLKQMKLRKPGLFPISIAAN